MEGRVTRVWHSRLFEADGGKACIVDGPRRQMLPGTGAKASGEPQRSKERPKECGGEPAGYLRSRYETKTVVILVAGTGHTHRYNHIWQAESTDSLQG
jgi:hypothetical protein